MKKSYLLLLFIFIKFSCFAQENKNALLWFDSYIGQENLDINSGEKYIEKYRALKGNYHFLFKEEINKADIEYDGQTYFDIPLIYDTLDQKVIVKIASETEDYLLILNKEKLNYFKVKNRNFYNLKGLGIYEELSSKLNSILYKRHSIKSSYFNSRGRTFNKFKTINSYLILYKNSYYKINSKKDFKIIFPAKKRIINDYYSKNKRNLKYSKDDFIIKLINKLVI